MSAPYNKEQELERAEARIKELEDAIAKMPLDTLVAKLSEQVYHASIAKGVAEAKVEQLQKELEIERMRLAACGVVAMANTPASAADARQMLPEYWSGSLDDVIRAVDEEMRLRDELAFKGKPVTPKVLKKVKQPREMKGRFHTRPDGKDCSYMAEGFCNKCGWVQRLDGP